MKDCSSCPSFVKPEDAAGIFGKQTAAPMCKRYSIPLGRPGHSAAQNEVIQQHFAMGCVGYGQSAPEKPEESRGYVMEPNASILAKFKDPAYEPDELNTCRNCENLIAPDVVGREIGFPIELCRAQGNLVFRPQKECKGCLFATRGEMSQTTDGLEILPEYREGFRISTEVAVEDVYSMGGTNIPPESYDSDAPVTDEHKLDGIVAWRAVHSPWGAESEVDKVLLPIFDPTTFPEEYQVRVPTTGDKNFPEQYVDYQNLLWDFATNGYMLRETLCLQSFPGMGKTEFARFVAYLKRVPLIEFNFQNDTEVDDLMGKTDLTIVNGDGGTNFIQGEIPRGIALPAAILLFDELNTAPGSIRQALRPYFAKGTEFWIHQASPAICVQRGKYNYSIVAQNPAHDVRNSGTEELASAEFDRLTVRNVELPPESVERHIIKMRTENDGFPISDSKLDKVMAIASDIREAANDRSIPFTWGIRQQIKVARKLRFYPLVEAYKLAALDFYEPEAVENVLKAISTH